MAKIPLTIDPGYCADWNAWEGTRELISNAKDAEDRDLRHAMEIQHFKRSNRLIIRTKDVSVDPSELLVLGRSGSRGRNVRGRFGEGFVIGCLALVRAGHDVSFRNHDANWKCAIERADADHPLASSNLLTFYSRQITPTADFEVTIESITEEVWVAMRKLFLFLTPPPPGDVIKVDQGTLILTPERKGQIFARGVFVRHFEKLDCAYDLAEVSLDRDRRMIDEWDLKTRLTDLWISAINRRDGEEAIARRAYDIVKSDTLEADHMSWRTDGKLLETMRAQFVAEHGADAVPVGTMAEAKQIEALGAKPAIVNRTLKELLGKAGISVEKATETLEGEIARRLAPSELSDLEARACGVVEVLAKEYVVVEFRGEEVLCRPIDKDALLGVDRRLLARPVKEILSRIAVAEGRRRRQEMSSILLEALTPIVRGLLYPPGGAEETTNAT